MSAPLRNLRPRYSKRLSGRSLDAFFVPSCEGSDYATKIDRYVINHSGPLTALRTVQDVEDIYVVGQPDIGGNRWLALGTNPGTPVRFLIPGVLVEKHFLPLASFPNIHMNPGGAVQSAWIWHGNSLEYRKVHNGINSIISFMGERAIFDRPNIFSDRHKLDLVMQIGKRLLTPENETHAPELENDELGGFADQGLLYTAENEIKCYELALEHIMPPEHREPPEQKRQVQTPLAPELVAAKQLVMCSIGFKVKRMPQSSGSIGHKLFCELFELTVVDRSAGRWRPSKRSIPASNALGLEGMTSP